MPSGLTGPPAGIRDDYGTQTLALLVSKFARTNHVSTPTRLDLVSAQMQIRQIPFSHARKVPSPPGVVDGTWQRSPFPGWLPAPPGGSDLT